jgi:hypothetical protein
MADTIKIKAGNKENMPQLADREIAYVRDEEALYIGSLGENKKVGGKLEVAVEACKKQVTMIRDAVNVELGKRLTATPVEAMSELSADADMASVVAAYNSLLAAMKSSGVMNT